LKFPKLSQNEGELRKSGKVSSKENTGAGNGSIEVIIENDDKLLECRALKASLLNGSALINSGWTYSGLL